MPMQPRPIAETRGPPRPSLRCFMDELYARPRKLETRNSKLENSFRLAITVPIEAFPFGSRAIVSSFLFQLRASNLAATTPLNLPNPGVGRDFFPAMADS